MKIQDRFKFRIPVVDKDGNFKKFVYFDLFNRPATTCRTTDVFKDTEQCTGLKDKNGKRIYEGDIVKSVATKFIGHIEYNISFASFFAIDESSCRIDGYYDRVCYFDDFFPTNEEVEIIGNIHENPDLEYEERSW